MKNSLILFVLLCFMASCERESIITVDDWGNVFKKHGIDSACFEMADNTHDQVFIYNLNRCSRRFSPASTFKIFLSLVALESNVALDENLMIAWNKIPSGKASWDKDMNMREALKVSSEPYYKELAKRIGAVEMQKMLDTIRYGNKRLGTDIELCWTNDTLQITPDEQVGFMKKLYFDKLPLSQRSQRIVRSMMLQEDSTNYKLYFKTGTKLISEEKYLAWMVGFVERKETQIGVTTKKEETNNRPYFFALNFESTDTTYMNPDGRKIILKELLNQKGILK